MLEVGDKVKWNGKISGEPMPAWLNTEMVGEIADVDVYDTLNIGVWFDDLYEVFSESELEVVK
jgi:hypothetical protein